MRSAPCDRRSLLLILCFCCTAERVSLLRGEYWAERSVVLQRNKRRCTLKAFQRSTKTPATTPRTPNVCTEKHSRGLRRTGPPHRKPSGQSHRSAPKHLDIRKANTPPRDALVGASRVWFPASRLFGCAAIGRDERGALCVDRGRGLGVELVRLQQKSWKLHLHNVTWRCCVSAKRCSSGTSHFALLLY